MFGFFFLILNLHLDFIEIKKQKVMNTLNTLNRFINATSILQSIYNISIIDQDKWVFRNKMNSKYSDSDLNLLEKKNMVISKSNRNYYKIKNNLVISVCCNPRLCFIGEED